MGTTYCCHKDDDDTSLEMYDSAPPMGGFIFRLIFFVFFLCGRQDFPISLRAFLLPAKNEVSE